MFNLFTQFLVLLPLLNFPIADGTSVPKLPIVDLGYELHQASSFNVSAFNPSAISLSPKLYTARERSLQFF